MELRVKTKIT